MPSNTRNLHVNNNNDGGGSGSSVGPALKEASCRAVWFSNTNHSRLYTGGSAGDLCCVDAEIVSTFSTTSTTDKKSILWRIDQASSSVGAKSPQNNNPIHCLHQLPSCSASGSLIVTGDDRGGVRLWDERLCDPTNPKYNQQKKTENSSNNNLLALPRGCVLSWKESKDYISAFDHSADGNTLLATSADGTLSVFDLRKASTSNILQNREAVRISDHQDDELLAIAVMKNGKKVVCGTTEGVLNVWSWGTWGDVSDRFPNAHEGNSIDAVLKVDENTLLTGSSDGLLRVVSILPDRFLGVLGGHDGFPIEALKYTTSRKYVGSLSHDQYIRLWDTRRLFDDGEDDSVKEGLDQDKELSSREMPVASSTAGRAKGGQASDDEWEDMDEGDEMEDGAIADEGYNSNDSDSDDSDNRNNSDGDDSDSNGDEKLPSQNDLRANKLKSSNEEFFADL